MRYKTGCAHEQGSWQLRLVDSVENTPVYHYNSFAKESAIARCCLNVLLLDCQCQENCPYQGECDLIMPILRERVRPKAIMQ